MTPLLCFSVLGTIDKDLIFADYCEDFGMLYSCTYRYELTAGMKGIINAVWFDPHGQKYYSICFPAECKETVEEMQIYISLRIGDVPIVRKMESDRSSLIKINELKELDCYSLKDSFSKEWQIMKESLTQRYSDKVYEAYIKDYNKYINSLLEQYSYRYVIKSELGIMEVSDNDNGIIKILEIREILFDATFDKLHRGNLLKYHNAGRPKKIAIKWQIRLSIYSAYFWFDEQEIFTIFDKFYGKHPESKTDFIININPISQDYQLSLYRFGSKEPVIIPQSAYQLIVFKSGFENYRSDNYNQPTGAWIW